MKMIKNLFFKIG